MEITTDTRQIYKSLLEHGFSEVQADGLTDALHRAATANVEQLATKDQLALVESKLEAKISAVQAELSAKITSATQQLTIRLGGLLVVAIGLMTAIQQLLS